MKVALAFPACHRRGGVERVMVECANFLAQRGADVTVFAAEWDQSALDATVSYHRVPASTSNSVARLITFNAGMKREVAKCNPQADVVGTFGALSPNGSVVWVTAVHRTWIEISKQRSLFSRIKQRCNLYHPIVLALERHVYGGRRYRKLIALSNQVKADLMRHYHVPSEDIVVIPNGFSPTEFSLDRVRQLRGQMRNQLGYNEQDRVVVFVANETERKGFGPLLRAIVSLNDSHVHLLAVGRLSATRYESEIKQLGLAERVKFTGPSGDVAQFYAAADVFCLPTQYEAWGLVITESLACGLPALTSRLAGAAVAIKPGMNGDLLDDPDSVEEIAAKLRPLIAGVHAPAEAIAQSVAAYAWPEVLQSYEALLISCAMSAETQNASKAGQC